MGALSSTFLIASAVLSAGSSVAGGVAQRRAARGAEREGRRLAEDALARGEEGVARYRDDLSQLLGAQTVGAAAQGIDPNQGSAAQIREQTEAIGEEDIATIRLNAMREARGIRSQAGAQAQQLRAASIGSFGQAGSTLLTTGVDAWSSWNRGRVTQSAFNRTANRVNGIIDGALGGLR